MFPLLVRTACARATFTHGTLAQYEYDLNQWMMLMNYVYILLYYIFYVILYYITLYDNIILYKCPMVPKTVENEGALNWRLFFGVAHQATFFDACLRQNPSNPEMKRKRSLSQCSCRQRQHHVLFHFFPRFLNLLPGSPQEASWLLQRASLASSCSWPISYASQPTCTETFGIAGEQLDESQKVSLKL